MLALGLLACAAAPNPIYDAAKYTTLVAKIPNGVLYTVRAPDAAPLDVCHVFGTAGERGEAQGRLISARIRGFLDVQMPTFYKQQIASLVGQLDNLPKWLQVAIRALAENSATKAFDLALGYVEQVQRQYNTASGLNLYEEIDGIARGVCAVATEDGVRCDPVALSDQIRKLNMLPDLIKMQCSMLGAWGDATPTGSLVQLRALDFGGGPFANNSILFVHHPSNVVVGSGGAARDVAGTADKPAPFASLAFPGFVGVVTGLSPHVALSEKVNDIAGGGTPAGSYDGEVGARSEWT